MTLFVPKKYSWTPIVTNICDDTKRTKKTLLSSKHFTWLVYFPLITIFFILQCHTRVSEKTFDVNSKIAQTTLITWNYRNVQSKRNGKLRRLSWRFQTLIWRLGDTVGSKIWSLLDHSGELTVLWLWSQRYWDIVISYCNNLFSRWGFLIMSFVIIWPSSQPVCRHLLFPKKRFSVRCLHAGYL